MSEEHVYPVRDDVAADAHIDAATYEAIHAEDPTKYADPKLVQNNRIRALEALARLGRPEDMELFLRLCDDEPDPAVREAAMKGRNALAAAAEGSGSARN